MIVGTNVNSGLRIDFGKGDKRVYITALIKGDYLAMEPADRNRLFACIDELKDLFHKHDSQPAESPLK